MGKKNKKHKKKKHGEENEESKEVEAKGEKKSKKEKPVEIVKVTHTKAESEKAYHAATGSRFSPGTSKQIALDIVCEGVKNGKVVKEIRKVLADYRRENGKDRDLDAGYFSYVVASHSEHFEVMSDGTVKLVKEFKPDPEVLEKLKSKEAERKERKKERKGNKNSNKGGKGKKPVVRKD